MIWQWQGDAFGDGKEIADPDGDGKKFWFPLRFPGQYYDGETGLNYNYYRDYDRQLGRYVQSDPIGILRDYSALQLQIAIRLGVVEESGAAGEMLNHAYGYVGQNPLFWIDPYGLANSGQPTNLGGGTTVRIDNPNTSGQQKHAHFKTPKGSGVVNKDGTPSHKNKGSLDNMNKKVTEYLKKKGFKLRCVMCFLIPDYERIYCEQHPYNCYEVPPEC